jgi:hypothetical protein
MSPARIRDPREPADPERRSPDAAPAPRLPGGVAGLTPERILALQRAGAGNHAISRVLARVEGEDEVEEVETTEEGGGGGGQPLLLTDRPWSEMFPPPLPLAQPAFDFELPIIIPRALIPPEWLWLFDFQAPPPKPGPSAAPLMIEYKPLVPEEPEQVEAQVEEAPVLEPGKKKRKPRKKKKKAQKAVEEQAQTAPAAAKTTAPPAEKQEAPKGALPLDDLMSWFDAPEPGTKATKKKGPAPTAPTPKKMTAAQKRDAKEREALKKKKAAEAERQDKLAAEQEAADKLAETKLRGALLAKLGVQKTQLAQARDGLVDDEDHDEIYNEADDEFTALDTYINGPGTTANSATLRAKSDAIASLISKVKHFKPPLTPEQVIAKRRQKAFDEAVTNVPLCFQQNDWEGAFGPQTSFQVDKNDDVLFDMIRGYFGRDVHQIPGHASKPYPTKTATSQVYYYVTAKSHTKYIAYDITAHVWDNNVRGETVHVLHIPHNG